jgi:hypothetical protein
MPTAAKLTAAVAFLAVAYLAAELYKPGLPPETQWGMFSILCAALGALCGWLIAGPRAGRGWRAAAGIGVRTSATIAFWALVGFSVYEMILRSMRMRYQGVFDAIEGTFDIMLMYGTALMRPEPVAALLLGGILAAWLAEWAGRRWR